MNNQQVKSETTLTESEIENLHLTIEKLNKIIKDQEDKIEELESEKEAYQFFCREEESDDIHGEPSDEQNIKLENIIADDASSEIRKDIEDNIEKEDRIISLGLEISRLQFEVSELFHVIKRDLTENEYERYKMEKRSFHKMVNVFYDIFKHEDKLEVFNILIKILKKQKKIFDYDNQIANIQ
jgi:hypothetical protein